MQEDKIRECSTRLSLASSESQKRRFGVDISKFQRDILKIPIRDPRLRSDISLYFILLVILHDDESFAAITQHEPIERLTAFVAECVRQAERFNVSKPLLCGAVIPGPPLPDLDPKFLSPSVFVEYLTLYYAQL